MWAHIYLTYLGRPALKKFKTGEKIMRNLLLISMLVMAPLSFASYHGGGSGDSSSGGSSGGGGYGSGSSGAAAGLSLIHI